VRGVQAPISREGPPPVAFLFLFFSRRRVLQRHWGRKSLLLAQSELFVSLLPALPAPDPPLLLTRLLLLFPLLHRARARTWAWGVGGSDRAAFTATLC
jgi:hypothetical protein